MQLDDVALEPEPRAGHVEPPHPGRALADLGHRLVPVRVEVGAPAGQGHRVVLAQVLLVPHLEPGVVDEGEQVARSFQLAVGEHVAVDETADHPARALVVRPGDAVVQQPSLGPQLAVQEGEVRRQLGPADVLGQPDRADRVELPFGHVAVVEVADLGQPAQALLLDGLLRPGRLLRGQGHAERLDAVLAGGVADHAAPAAAHVEQPHPGAQAQLPGHQVVLVGLRLFQGRIGPRVTGAGVRHRRAEHPLVERVGHVVVVRDGRGVALLGMQPPREPAAVHPDLLRRRRDPGQQQPGAAEVLQQPEPLGQVDVHLLGLDHPGQRVVHVALDVEVPGHVRPGQAERARRLGQVGHRHRGPHGDPHRGVLGARPAPVVGTELHRGVGARHLLKHVR